MRCEICGAPVGDGETRCARCSDRKSNGVSATRRISRRATKDPNAYSGERPGRSSDPLRQEARAQQLPMPKSTSDVPSQMPSSIVLDGKYRLMNELGRGSMGTVFAAEDKSLKRKVAVKFLLPELADSTECATRFQREAVAMASIRDANVAQIFAYGEENGTPYFVMEHLDGETVEHLIDSQNRRGFYVPVDDAVDIMIQATQGLDAIHRVGAIHRDLKPANIMLTADPMRAVIMDFGLVRDIKWEDESRTLAGTPAYIAPELVEGKVDADLSKLTDIYSLGTTFYELVTGSIPFGGDTWVEILQKHIAEIPVFPSTRRPGIPEFLDDIILRAMAKEPQERYQSCEELLDDLIELQSMPLPHERRPSMAPTSERPSVGSSSRLRRASPSGRHKTVSKSNRAFRSTPNGSRGKLLVADGDHEFRSAVHAIAKGTVPGCRVHSASDGPMALDLVKQVKPNVLIVDLSLPEINGLEVVMTLRGEADNDNVEIIAVSGKGGKKEASILKSLGVTRFLTKPVDDDDLAQILRPLLERPMTISAPPVAPY